MSSVLTQKRGWICIIHGQMGTSSCRLSDGTLTGVDYGTLSYTDVEEISHQKPYRAKKQLRHSGTVGNHTYPL